MICIDNAGYQFLDSCNESENFVNAGINLKFLEFDSVKDGVEYSKELRRCKTSYNKSNHKICFKQNLNSSISLPTEEGRGTDTIFPVVA